MSKLQAKTGIYYPPEVRRREYRVSEYIPTAILPSCQYIYENIVLILHRCEYSWVVKIRNTSEAVLRPQYTLGNGHHTDRGSMGLGQYNTLGEYCGLHTASSVFLISLLATCVMGLLHFSTRTTSTPPLPLPQPTTPLPSSSRVCETRVARGEINLDVATGRQQSLHPRHA